MATLQNEIERAKQVTAKAKAETESARAELKLQRESLKRAEEFGQALDALEQALDRQIDDLSKAVVSGHHRVAEFNQVRGTCSPFWLLTVEGRTLCVTAASVCQASGLLFLY